jgi:tetratricopeptide (TPR) repeat protein
MYYKNTESQEDFQRQSLRTLDLLTNQEDVIKREVNTLVSPFLSSLLGSLQAARVEKDSDISKLVEAEDLLIKGCDSDVSSGRLKLASYFYCSGKMERAESILNETKTKYDQHLVEPICRCYHEPRDTESMNLAKFQEERNQVVKNIVAFCVIFLPFEIKWIPKELQHEMYRMTGDKAGMSDEVTWMDWAVVDSLPYIHFLQYKVNKHFHDEGGQQRALLNMEQSIDRTRNLCHRETALNLLGQCMEQNKQPIKALQCFSKSLRLQPRNNAAKVLICMCLASLFQTEDEVTKTIYQRQRKMEQN